MSSSLGLGEAGYVETRDPAPPPPLERWPWQNKCRQKGLKKLQRMPLEDHVAGRFCRANWNIAQTAEWLIPNTFKPSVFPTSNILQCWWHSGQHMLRSTIAAPAWENAKAPPSTHDCPCIFHAAQTCPNSGVRQAFAFQFCLFCLPAKKQSPPSSAVLGSGRHAAVLPPEPIPCTLLNM